VAWRPASAAPKARRCAAAGARAGYPLFRLEAVRRGTSKSAGSESRAARSIGLLGWKGESDWGVAEPAGSAGAALAALGVAGRVGAPTERRRRRRPERESASHPFGRPVLAEGALAVAGDCCEGEREAGSEGRIGRVESVSGADGECASHVVLQQFERKSRPPLAGLGRSCSSGKAPRPPGRGGFAGRGGDNRGVSFGAIEDSTREDSQQTQHRRARCRRSDLDDDHIERDRPTDQEKTNGQVAIFADPADKCLSQFFADSVQSSASSGDVGTRGHRTLLSTRVGSGVRALRRIRGLSFGKRARC
jgi:hypothetical protein